MGAISKIRQLSPYFLGVVATLFIVFMVLQDSSCSTFRQNRKAPEHVAVADVNGEQLSLADYEKRVQTIIDRQRQQNPNQEIDDAQIRQQVFDEMVNEMLRRQEAEKLGLTVTKAELIDVIAINPPAELQYWKDSTGRFQKELWQDLVTNPNRMSEMLAQQGAPQDEIDRQQAAWIESLYQIEDAIRIQKLEEALKSTVEATTTMVSPLVAETDYKSNTLTANVKFVSMSVDRIRDEDMKPTDEELKAYYEKNKQYYEQKRTRRMKYASFVQAPSDKDSNLANKRSMKLQELFAALPTPAQRDSAFTVEMQTLSGTSTDFKPVNEVDASVATILMSMQRGDVFGPLTLQDGTKYFRLDSLREGTNTVARASHILISFDADKAAAKKKADSITLLVKAGSDFSILAMQHSKDQGSASQGGDVGFFGKGRMVKEFEDAAFNNPIGAIVGPVETQFGYHIIKVTDKQSTELKYSEISIKPVISSATRQQTIAKAAQMQKQIEDGAPIDSVAKSYNIKVIETPFFNDQSPVLSSAELTAWAFAEEKGAVTRKDIKYYGLVIAQLTETREAGIKQFDDVKDEIKPNVVRMKKLDYLKTLANKVAATCKSAGNLDAARTVDSTLEVRIQSGVRNNGQLQGFGNEFEATNAAFAQPLNTVSGAIRGNRAWFVMLVEGRSEFNAEEFKAQKLMWTQNMASQAKSQAYYAWFQKVRENSEVTDKRFTRD